MELGGKSPCLILPDAELENAVDGAMMANFFSTGQVCTNGTRVFVPNSKLSAFETRVVEKMAHVRPGPVMDPSTNFGPLVSRAHSDKVTKYIQHGIEQDKAKLLYGGLGLPKLASGADKKGYWIKPTIFTNCTDSMLITREEIFGPVMTILPYDDSAPDYIDTLITRANDTRMGLAAGVFTKDINLGHRVIGRIEAGICWVNTWGESPAEMPVGGWKMSGLGVENGRRGLDNWVQNKSTLVEMGGCVGTVFAKL
jgi:betaine-aldehyde dehydrogenase